MAGVLATAAFLTGCGGGSTELAAPETTAPTVVPATTAATVTPPKAHTPTTTTTIPERLTDASRLRLDGIGPIRVGMTLEQAEVASGARLQVANTRPGSDCTYARPLEGPNGLAFMLDGRLIVRVDVGLGPDGAGSKIATLSGVHIGSTEADVMSTYPARITVEGHPYVRGGHYLVYVPVDPASKSLSLIFETDGQRVTSFRSGYADQVSWIEGCS